MSNIPTSAMPRAGDFNDNDNANQAKTTGEGGESSGITGTATNAFNQLADKARENPKTAIAAGAAVAAGVVAAATLTARSRGRGKKSKDGGKN